MNQIIDFLLEGWKEDLRKQPFEPCSPKDMDDYYETPQDWADRHGWYLDEDGNISV